MSDENTFTVDHEKWGRLLYTLYREHTLYRGSRTMLPDWGDVEPKEQRAWMSDASEFIRAWEQKRQATTDVLSAAIRDEGRVAELREVVTLLRRMTVGSPGHIADLLDLRADRILRETEGRGSD